MADETIVITDTVAPADDPSLLDIVDEISIRINGIAAQASTNRPTKSEIIAEVNAVQKKINNKYDWNYLRDVQAVNGYSVGTDTTTLTGGAVSTNTGTVSGTAGSTHYTAEKITVGNTPVFTNTITIPMFLYGGIGALSCNATVSVVNDLNGSPDLTDEVSASATVALDSVVGETATDISFTFAADDAFLKENTAYWIVIKKVYGSTNGRNLVIGTVATSGTSSATTRNSSDGSSWVASISGKVAYTMPNFDCTYLSEIELPLAVQKIYRVYTGSSTNPSCNLLPWQDDKFINDPESTPTDKFVLRTFADTGEQVVYINPSVANIETWYVEYKRKTPVLADDTSLPIIPATYRGLITDQCTLNFWNRSFGQQDPENKQSLLLDITDAIKSMKREYLPHSPLAFSAKFANRTSMDEAEKNPLPNRAFVKRGTNILRTRWG